MTTTITDTHNRRRDINIISKRCKENLFPYLAWPQDKALLKLEDLPVITRRQPNYPHSWCSCEQLAVTPCRNDEELRAIIREGFAYAVITETTIGKLVATYRVRVKTYA